MVVLAGPRQVGKTRLAKHRFAKKDCFSLRFIWDDIAARQACLKDKQRLPVLKETLLQMGLEYCRDGIDYIGTGGNE